jgi:hypothetical protein
MTETKRKSEGWEQKKRKIKRGREMNELLRD